MEHPHCWNLPYYLPPHVTAFKVTAALCVKSILVYLPSFLEENESQELGYHGLAIPQRKVSVVGGDGRCCDSFRLAPPALACVIRVRLKDT